MEEDIFAWNLPPQTLQSWERLPGASPSPRGRGRPPFGSGRECGSCDPFTTTTWGTLGMERMGGTMQPFMFVPGEGSSRPRVASAFDP